MLECPHKHPSGPGRHIEPAFAPFLEAGHDFLPRNVLRNVPKKGPPLWAKHRQQGAREGLCVDDLRGEVALRYLGRLVLLAPAPGFLSFKAVDFLEPYDIPYLVERAKQLQPMRA